MTVPTIRLKSGELLIVGYQSMLDSSPEVMEEPHRTLEIDLDKFKKVSKNIKTCGRCGRELEQWEINVNIANYYSDYSPRAGRGKPKRRCYSCACKEM